LTQHLGKVQQELLRHADIRTTMNIYTHPVPAASREANSKVVGSLANLQLTAKKEDVGRGGGRTEHPLRFSMPLIRIRLIPDDNFY
jgi:hypothetical protein